MIKDINLKKRITASWFKLLQQIICYEFEKIEIDYAKLINKKPKLFKKNEWRRSKTKNNGGGSYFIIKNGLIFDSVGVNFSEVTGKYLKFNPTNNNNF